MKQRMYRTDDEKLALIDGFAASGDGPKWLRDQGISISWFYTMRQRDEKALRRARKAPARPRSRPRPPKVTSALVPATRTPSSPVLAPIASSSGIPLESAIHALEAKHALMQEFLDDLRRLASTGSILRT